MIAITFFAETSMGAKVFHMTTVSREKAEKSARMYHLSIKSWLECNDSIIMV